MGGLDRSKRVVKTLLTLWFTALVVAGCTAHDVPQVEPEPVAQPQQPAQPGEHHTAFEQAEPRNSLVLHRLGAGDDKVVVLLHGYGADGRDLVPLAESLLSPGVHFVVPEAPHPRPSGGRMWYELRQADSDTLHDSRARIEALIAQLETEGYTPDQIILGGFSQGAMISLFVARQRAAEGALPLGGLVLLSGSTLDTEWRSGRDEQAVGASRAFVSHGRQDQVLPIDVSERIASHLSSAGLEVTEVYFDGGHNIAPRVRAELLRWLQ